MRLPNSVKSVEDLRPLRLRRELWLVKEAMKERSMEDTAAHRKGPKSDFSERLEHVQKRARETGLVPDGHDDKELMDAMWGADAPESACRGG